MSAEIDDLDVGDSVRVRARGAIVDSCPAQGVGSAVEITGP